MTAAQKVTLTKVGSSKYAVDLAAVNAAMLLKADATALSPKADTTAMTAAIAAAIAGITHPVSSVNGKTGVVVLNAADIGLRAKAFSVALLLTVGNGTATVTDASITAGSVPFAVIIGANGALDTVRVTCDVPTTGQFVVNLSRLLTLARTYNGWAFWLNP